MPDSKLPSHNVKDEVDDDEDDNEVDDEDDGEDDDEDESQWLITPQDKASGSVPKSFWLAEVWALANQRAANDRRGKSITAGEKNFQRTT